MDYQTIRATLIQSIRKGLRLIAHERGVRYSAPTKESENCYQVCQD